MKRFILLISIIWLISSFQIKAQILDEIKSYVDSSEFIVNNGRKMLINKIAGNEYEKTREIYIYLTELTAGNNYSAFSFTEDLWINILVGSWGNITELMINYNQDGHKKIYPETFEIVSALYDKVTKECDLLSFECLNSELDFESKKVMDLLFYMLKTGTADQVYNSKLKEFRKSFPESKYNDFINGFLPGIKIKTSFAWSIGSGINYFTENLAEDYKPNASVNMSFDFNIGRVFSSFYLRGTNMKLKIPFSILSNTGMIDFEYNEKFHFFDAGVKAGYFMVRNNYFHVAPYLSASGSVFESTLYDTESDGDEYQILNCFTYGAGLHTEVKIKEFEYKNMYGYGTNNFISLKLEGGYNIFTKFKDNYFKGNNPYITVAFVWGMGDF